MSRGFQTENSSMAGGQRAYIQNASIAILTFEFPQPYAGHAGPEVQGLSAREGQYDHCHYSSELPRHEISHAGHEHT